MRLQKHIVLALARRKHHPPHERLFPGPHQRVGVLFATPGPPMSPTLRAARAVRRAGEPLKRGESAPPPLAANTAEKLPHG